ncbi:GntR family transcriptional regulator [Microbacterium sp. 18062]|uniref:GntR family transcriptional regulator n=1 Tax=Microbacterium sp. 18062 TaxID=2681410 RepID=UPI00135AF735|nr:GntR family transcriptional regulator [Microbacterium sp. 18062]
MQTQVNRVRDLIDAALKSGVYEVGEPLIEDRLMVALGASRTAVRTALRMLADQGRLIRKPRVGTLPVPSGVRVAIDDISYLDPIDPSHTLAVTIRVTDRRPVPTSALLAAVLETDDPYVRLTENVYVHDGEVFGMRTAYYRLAAGLEPRVVQIADMPQIARDVFQVDQLIVDSTEIGTAEADAASARVLGVEPHTRVLTRRQVFVDRDAHPVQVAFDQYRPDEVTFVSMNAMIRARPSGACETSGA